MDISAISMTNDERPRRTETQRANYIYAFTQSLILLFAVLLIAALGYGVRLGLTRNGIGFDMGFLWSPANFDISEGSLPTWTGFRHFIASDTNAQALLVGFLNTVKVSVLAIAAATVMGVLIGIARVSRNWLVRQLSFGLVEFIRNTPLLIQLVFWYFAVALKLPGIADASTWLGGIILSQQGFYLPAMVGIDGASFAAIWAFLLALLLLGGSFKRGHQSLKLAGGALSMALAIVIGFPVGLEIPKVDGMSVIGGLAITPEFGALLVGLSVYTAAFIAEIVRGAIISLPRGQWEAASALGLSRRATFVDIVIPQVFRVVLPSFGNQYISLAKSTSLGIAIGFSDLFNVYGTVANQSGRSLEGVMVVMLSYLFLSWVISAFVNLANKQILKKGAAR